MPCDNKFSRERNWKQRCQRVEYRRKLWNGWQSEVRASYQNTITKCWLVFVPTATLAPEIIDVIIDHLHDDTATLCAFSLTCKKLLLSNRYHLFSHIVISPLTIENFLELLKSTLCDIGSLVRRLEIRHYESFSCFHEQISLRDANQQLLTIPRHLNNLSNLEIYNSPDIDLAFLKGLTTVREVELVNIYFEMEKVLRILNTLRDLQSFSMDDIRWPSEENSSALDRPLSPLFLIRRLRLEPTTFNEMIIFLMEQTPIPAVLDLHCNASNPKIHSSLVLFLEAVGHSVQSLHLDLRSLPEPQG